MFKLVTLVAVGAFLGESAALAGSCNVQSSKPHGHWTFVHVYDVDNGHIVLRQAINGGDSKHVTVSGHRLRVEHKTAGHRMYRADPEADCKDGNTVKF
jgi:hypothetical protein